ncbi:hypothetical protein C0Q44_13080 [Paenibacillus sp. PCH8]|uniref:hypothetical protein n=1 Tax=Paenibacillus sp. PCH8 TaxID=2066524 RepID=UPI000CF9B320|nr:hypothetical protein [Paenibacillus sp. PCH8]PQP82380.1 hypothetical protein C0Q44_13080 [Paenibacillus sp. PCH8]
MFELDIEDNIKLTLEVSESYLQNIIVDRSNVKNYKMLILNLHNALELTFKYLLQSRNEFLIYEMQDSNSYRKVINSYKKRKLYNEKMPKGKNLHTVSFTKAYEILAYLYNEERFDEKFIFKLMRLNTLRNGLTHFTAKIEYTDIIVLYSLFEECVNLYNSELDNERYSFERLLQEGSNKFSPNPDLAHDFSNAIKDIKIKVLEEPIIIELIGSLIQKLEYVNGDIRLDDYERLMKFFYDKQSMESMKRKKVKSPTNDQGEIFEALGYTYFESEEFREKIKKQDLEYKAKMRRLIERMNRMKSIYDDFDDEKSSISFDEFLLNSIFITLESEFIYSRTYYDSNDMDLMDGLSLTLSCKNLILDKWNNDKVKICKVFDLSDEEYFNLLDFEGDFYSKSYYEEETDFSDDEL